MKKIFPWVIFILLFLACENISFCSEQETIAMFDKQVMLLEDIWKAGKTNAYFLKAKDIGINMAINIIARNIKKDFTTNDMNRVASRLFENLISKEVNIIDVKSDDLNAINEVASCLILNDSASIKERRLNALLLCRFLGRIRKEIIPNYKPRPVYLNVSPPLDAPPQRGGYRSGMAPSAITDSVVRAKYEAAIRENRENGIVNKRQQELEYIERKIKTKITNYMVKTFNSNDVSSPLFAECLKAARLTDKEKEEVLKKVSIKLQKSVN